MTEDPTMQQPSDNIQSMFPQESPGHGPPHGNHVETQRSTDPGISLEDYNRTMLEYTQRQISSFVDCTNDKSRRGASSLSSQGSGNSGRSGASGNGVLACQANGPPPTSAGTAAAAASPGAHQYPYQKPV